eukprot:m.1195206 g.1195206  ORF g.1195206 m.1195206 type:complete len:213 (+) comp24562_c1_seq63:70-708(+)
MQRRSGRKRTCHRPPGARTNIMTLSPAMDALWYQSIVSVIVDPMVFKQECAMRGPHHTQCTTFTLRVRFVCHSGCGGRCASTIGSSVFCVSGGSDGRDGPFMVYNTPSAAPGARALYRCSNTSLGAQQAQTHAHAAAMPASFLSTDARCEGLGSQPDELIGYIAAQRGGETLRALRRCFPPGDQASLPGARTHALDLECLGHPDGDVLGYVR